MMLLTTAKRKLIRAPALIRATGDALDSFGNPRIRGGLFPTIPPFVNVAAISKTANIFDPANQTTYMNAGLSFGDAAGDRKMIAAISGAGTVGTETVLSATIGGIASTLVVAGNTAGGGRPCELWQADVPTGATGTVSVTFTSGCSSYGLGLYRVTGAAAAAHQTKTSTANPPTNTIDCPANGIIVALSIWANGDGTATWTNLTENFDEMEEAAGQGHTGASDAFATMQTARAITCTHTAGTQHSLAMASFGPAS